MGIFRSLGALARAIGPVVSCTGKFRSDWRLSLTAEILR